MYSALTVSKTWNNHKQNFLLKSDAAIKSRKYPSFALCARHTFPQRTRDKKGPYKNTDVILKKSCQVNAIFFQRALCAMKSRCVPAGKLIYLGELTRGKRRRLNSMIKTRSKNRRGAYWIELGKTTFISKRQSIFHCFFTWKNNKGNCMWMCSLQLLFLSLRKRGPFCFPFGKGLFYCINWILMFQ